MDLQVDLEGGPVVFRELRAKHRNAALKKSMENVNGKLQVNEVQFIIELLPLAIATHPWGTTPVRTALDNLSISEYDKLTGKLKDIIGGVSDEEKKESEPQSEVAAE